MILSLDRHFLSLPGRKSEGMIWFEAKWATWRCDFAVTASNRQRQMRKETAKCDHFCIDLLWLTRSPTQIQDFQQLCTQNHSSVSVRKMTGNLDEFRRSVLLPPAVGLQFRSPLVLYSGGGTSCLLVVSSYLETTILYYTYTNTNTNTILQVLAFLGFKNYGLSSQAPVDAGSVLGWFRFWMTGVHQACMNFGMILAPWLKITPKFGGSVFRKTMTDPFRSIFGNFGCLKTVDTPL